MGIFANLGRTIAGKSREKPSAKGASLQKSRNNGSPYRLLDEATQAQALAATSKTLLASLGIEILRVPATPEAGFTMGSTKYNGEKPVRQVILSEFGLSETPITNAQYAAYLEATEQENKLDFARNKADHPVVSVSWFEANSFCKWLSKETGGSFRLPTEAEWEYAARGFDGREYPWGNTPLTPKLANYFHAKSPKTITPVGQYPKGVGPFGHLDLAGNVWEWCYDWYADYDKGDVDNPKGPKTENYKVLRGGSWLSNNPLTLRCALRVYDPPDNSYDIYGFRVAEDYNYTFTLADQTI